MLRELCADGVKAGLVGRLDFEGGWLLGEGEDAAAVAAEEGDAAEGDDEADDAVGGEGGLVVEVVDEDGGGDDFDGGEGADELDEAVFVEMVDDPGAEGAPQTMMGTAASQRPRRS